MKFVYKFAKILSMKEQEKDEAVRSYQDAVSAFENVAQELYRLLKKKEDLMNFQSEKLMTGLSIQEMRHFQGFLSSLEKSIHHYQELVVNARTRMNWYEEQLQQKNIEVKKYEKIKSKEFKRYLHLLSSEENKQIDEISTRQYFQQIGR